MWSITLKKLVILAALMAPSLAGADSYILGAGRWTCEDLVQANQNEDWNKNYQAIGWLLGYWSAETRYRTDRFVDIVEQAGGRAIYDQTVVECGKAPAGTLVYEIAQSMIENTQ